MFASTKEFTHLKRVNAKLLAAGNSWCCRFRSHGEASIKRSWISSILVVLCYDICIGVEVSFHSCFKSKMSPSIKCKFPVKWLQTIERKNERYWMVAGLRHSTDTIIQTGSMFTAWLYGPFGVLFWTIKPKLSLLPFLQSIQFGFRLGDSSQLFHHNLSRILQYETSQLKRVKNPRRQ